MRALFTVGFLILGLFAIGEGILIGVYGIRSFWTNPPIQLPKTSGEITLLSVLLGALIAAGGVGFLYLATRAFFHKPEAADGEKRGKVLRHGNHRPRP